MYTLLPLIPLSLLLSISSYASVQAVSVPLQVRTSMKPSTNLARRASATMPLTNNGNAQYIVNMTLAGESVRVLLDSGSSDLWVAFPNNVPETKDLGQGLTLNYAIGSASGSIHSAQMKFDDYTIEDQAFLLVKDTSSFTSDIHSQGYDGLMGIGPNEGSQVRDKIDQDSADSVLERIFKQDPTTGNFISFLLDRKGDASSNFTGQFTISEYVKGFESVANMPKLDVETVHRLLDEDQHWQALTDKDAGLMGPDGQLIPMDSIVPRAPDGQMVAVFDSGFTFTQVPRDVSDAIYGRVQGAKYDSKNEWWTVPCGQYINITFFFGGKPYPIHPLDTVDNSFSIKDSSGNEVCIGTFQPITSAFSMLGNYDMIMGMSFLRNTYTILDFGDWSDDGTTGNPFIQILSVSDVAESRQDFIRERLGGVDTIGDQKWKLLPTDQMQHSPVSEEERRKRYQEMILSRWPYILGGCLAFVALLTGYIVWRCCCRKRRSKTSAKAAKRSKGGLKGGFYPPLDKEDQSTSYLPLQKPSPSLEHLNYNGNYGGGGYRY